MMLPNGDTDADDDDRNIENSAEYDRNGKEESDRIGDTNVEPGADRALVDEHQKWVIRQE